MKTKLAEALEFWLANVTPEKSTGLIPVLRDNGAYFKYTRDNEYIYQLTPEEKVIFALLILESEES